MDEPDHVFEGYDANPQICRHCGAIRPLPCYRINRKEFNKSSGRTEAHERMVRLGYYADMVAKNWDNQPIASVLKPEYDVAEVMREMSEWAYRQAHAMGEGKMKIMFDPFAFTIEENNEFIRLGYEPIIQTDVI